MFTRHRRLLTVAVLATATTLSLSACSRGSQQANGAGPTATGEGSCPDVVASADAALTKALDLKPSWTGPTTGPKAASNKTIIFVAQTLTNPGVAAAAKGVKEAGAAIGWNVRTIDGQGDPAGISAAMGQALTLKPAGIVIGGFDPGTVTAQVKQANAAGIQLIGWHAVADPGPSQSPKLFTNITTKVDDVAKISAQYIISKSKGTAGVVVFTDDSIPFAAGKAKMIETDLAECASVKILEKENIPIPDAGTRTPQAFSSLVSKLADTWTYSVAINDLYFDNAATPLRAAGKTGGGPPYSVGAGDGSSAAFQRISAKQFQAATVPAGLADDRRVQPRLQRQAGQWVRRPDPRNRHLQRRPDQLVGSRQRLPRRLQEDLGQVGGSGPGPVIAAHPAVTGHLLVRKCGGARLAEPAADGRRLRWRCGTPPALPSRCGLGH
jgi:ribose transport system substrate-binding protein